MVKNMKIYDTYRSAITIATVDGAIIEDVEIDGVESIHTGNPIFLRTGTRHTRDDQKPILRNIVIKNMYAEVPLEKPDAGYSYEGPVEDLPRNVCPSIIAGVPGIRIENVPQLVPVENARNRATMNMIIGRRIFT